MGAMSAAHADFPTLPSHDNSHSESLFELRMRAQLDRLRVVHTSSEARVYDAGLVLKRAARRYLQTLRKSRCGYPGSSGASWMHMQYTLLSCRVGLNCHPRSEYAVN